MWRNWKGDELVRRARAAGAEASKATAEAVLASTRVPVRTGRLRASGRVEEFNEGQDVGAAVVFGGGRVFYAIALHERSSRESGYLRDPFVRTGPNALRHEMGRAWKERVG